MPGGEELRFRRCKVIARAMSPVDVMVGVRLLETLLPRLKFLLPGFEFQCQVGLEELGAALNVCVGKLGAPRKQRDRTDDDGGREQLVGAPTAASEGAHPRESRAGRA